ncbi:hypothetical protein QBC43DRAFT_355188 [Cladorrhinum sp. PSN259]|nr:hypothetical protein QBC43DRAFT_355188 [Cladorrhinum sp. PSN259]
MKSTYVLAALAYGMTVEAGLGAIVDKVVARQGWGGGGGGGSDCEWAGHCLGDTCKSNIECDGDLDCIGNKCVKPGTVATTTRRPSGPGGGGPTTIVKTTTVYVYPTTTARTTARTTTARPPVSTSPGTGACGWTGHCIGDPCLDENDCDNDYICQRSKCAAAGPGTTVVSTTRRITTTSLATSTRRTTPAPPVTTSKLPPVTGPKCDTPLACIGASCQTDADCGFDLIICKEGFCGI